MARITRTHMERVGRWLLQLVHDLRMEWVRDRVPGLSAEIAFFALLGLFPAVIVFAAALGSLDEILGESAAADTEQWLLERVTELFGGDNSLATTISDLFASSNTSALTVGIVLALYASSRGFVAVVRALDVAYDHQDPRSWWSTRIVGIALTAASLVVAVLVMTMIVVGPLLGEGGELADDIGAGRAFTTGWTWFRWPVVFLMLIAWTATIYHVAPNHKSPWRWELPGAVLGTVWWVVVSLGFRFYLVAASSGANAVFGLLGGALSLIFWLYLLSMGLLAGAEINGILATRRRRRLA